MKPTVIETPVPTRAGKILRSERTVWPPLPVVTTSWEGGLLKSNFQSEPLFSSARRSTAVGAFSSSVISWTLFAVEVLSEGPSGASGLGVTLLEACGGAAEEEVMLYAGRARAEAERESAAMTVEKCMMSVVGSRLERLLIEKKDGCWNRSDCFPRKELGL